MINLIKQKLIPGDLLSRDDSSKVIFLCMKKKSVISYFDIRSRTLMTLNLPNQKFIVTFSKLLDVM
jgi:hypothetical protein